MNVLIYRQTIAHQITKIRRGNALFSAQMQPRHAELRRGSTTTHANQLILVFANTVAIVVAPGSHIPDTLR